jgi:hypothetical protein
MNRGLVRCRLNIVAVLIVSLCTPIEVHAQQTKKLRLTLLREAAVFFFDQVDGKKLAE